MVPNNALHLSPYAAADGRSGGRTGAERSG